MIAGLAGTGLFISGAVHEGDTTVFLLSPAEPGFWARVTASPEFGDGLADPLDRWSRRIIGALAKCAGGTAVFPFSGPPYLPFQAWARRSGQFFTAPVGLLVHPVMGLWASMRGALVLPGRLPLPPAAVNPCTGCAAPCRSACPADALAPTAYDLDACHAFLSRAEGESCLSEGCAARRACPAGQAYGRLPQQSAWHMRHFHK